MKSAGGSKTSELSKQDYSVAQRERIPAKTYSLADFSRFCRSLVLDSGKFMRLEPHERTALADYFAGVVETVIIIAKKNGKTTLLGALALYHLLRVPDAECVIAAASRDQARILFKQAAGLVRRSGLEEVFDVKSGYGEIRTKGERLGGRIRILAADSATADGVIPTLALVDELHRHPSGELYGVFRDGLGPRAGQMITISTAGATMASPLGMLREKAHALPGFRRDETKRYNYSSSPDGYFVLHEWCLGDTDDPGDMKLVKKVNPASWQTIPELRRRHDSPSTTPWQWLRFACGVWTEGEEPWIDPPMWDKLAEPGLELADGVPTWLAVDIGVRRDTTGLALVQLVEEEVWAKVIILTSSSLAKTEQRIRELGTRYLLEAVIYDTQGFQRSADILESEGLPMVEFPQSVERMVRASAALDKLVREEKLHHDGDPELRAQVLAGRVKETERGWRFVKDPTLPRPIDALIALAVSVHVATSDLGSAFPTFELL